MPGAKRNAILGERAGALRVAVTAAARAAARRTRRFRRSWRSPWAEDRARFSLISGADVAAEAVPVEGIEPSASSNAAAGWRSCTARILKHRGVACGRARTHGIHLDSRLHQDLERVDVLIDRADELPRVLRVHAVVLRGDPIAAQRDVERILLGGQRGDVESAVGVELDSLACPRRLPGSPSAASWAEWACRRRASPGL